ncbi:MAG: sensor histidine kinase [Thermomicrobiales bacterium]
MDAPANAPAPSGPHDTTAPADASAEEHDPLAWRDVLRGGRFQWPGYLIAVLAVIALTAVMLPWRESLGVINCLLGFVALSMLLGLILGIGPSALGAVLSFFTFDFFFIKPYGTLDIANRDHVLALVIYLGIALVTSVLVGRLRARTVIAEREERRTSLLYDLNRDLVRGETVEQVLHTIAASVVSIYGAAASRVLAPTAGGDSSDLRVLAHAGTAKSTADQETRWLAQWAIDHRQVAGFGNEGRRIRTPHGIGQPPNPHPHALRRARSDALFVPIMTPDRVYGVLEVRDRPGGGRFSREDARLLGSFADQAALAIERGELAEQAMRASALAQANDLKSSLLAAVSHDLRTPLTTIKASATALLDDSITWDPAARKDLLSAIDEDADRLTLMVSNLLDLSRIEGGVLRPDLDWQDLPAFMDDVRDRVRSVVGMGHHDLTIDLDPGAATSFPPVRFDYVEIMQVMINLIGNAAKYSPDGAPIAVRASVRGDTLRIAVTDAGLGIPPDRLPRIFETFYRAHDKGPVSGSGIGLAICKGIVEAHGGTITARSEVGRGTTITVTLPLAGADGSAA